jgi:hypothetical protein
LRTRVLREREVRGKREDYEQEDDRKRLAALDPLALFGR